MPASKPLRSEADLERVAASILKWGWTNPVLVNEQSVLNAGHGRVAAAAKLGLQLPIPVIVARRWSEEEKQAYRLAPMNWRRAGTRTPICCAVSCAISNLVGFDLDLFDFERTGLKSSWPVRGRAV